MCWQTNLQFAGLKFAQTLYSASMTTSKCAARLAMGFSGTRLFPEMRKLGGRLQPDCWW